MGNEFELEKNLVILSVPTILKLLSHGKIGNDALNLYVFYYSHAKRQQTNQPKATPQYCQKGLHWGREKFWKADKLLRTLKLIEKIPAKDGKGKIVGWYVKLNYIWTTSKEREISPEVLKTDPEVTETRSLENPECGKETINALSVNNNINALSDKKNNINILNQNSKKKKEEEIIRKIIEDFNKICGTSYKPTTSITKKLIKARLKEGFTLEDFKTVHRKMFAAWSGDNKMRPYLRPQTLYTNKFEAYLNRPDDLSISTAGAKTFLAGQRWLAKEEAKNAG